MPASSQSRELVANQPFMVLLAARTISMLGMAFAPVALAFGILGLPGADAGTLSIVLASQTIPLVVFMLVGGVVADRYPRALVLRWGQLVAAAAWGSIGVMMLTGHTPLWLLCVAAAFAGMAGSAVYPALTGIIPDLVPVHLLQQGNAWLSMGASAARFAGLVASGAVVVWLGGGWAMVVAGTLYLVAATLSSFLPRTSALARGEESPLRQLRDGWGEFRSRQWLFVCVLQWAVMLMVLQASQGVLGPVVAQAELGGAAGWTYVLAGEALGAILGVGIAMVWRPRRPIFVATLLTFSAAAPQLLLGVSAPLWTVVAAAFVMGIGFDLFGVLWMTTMQHEVPAESLSRVASYDALGSLMLGPIGLLLAGPAAAAFGVHAALIGTGVVSIATTLFALAFPEVRRLRSRPAPLPVEVVEAA
ncbi:MAG: MFS transporter [Propionicimonas sp.]|uniref:MFS transporter n=1 Tax=Propionicimonas sp. TaxID=1955623 RepID=UPI003D109CDB